VKQNIAKGSIREKEEDERQNVGEEWAIKVEKQVGNAAGKLWGKTGDRKNQYIGGEKTKHRNTVTKTGVRRPNVTRGLKGENKP